LLMPLAGTLASRVQARYMIAFGWLAISAALYYTTQHLDLDISFGTASVLRVFQVFGLGFLFVPISLVSYVGMPAQKSSSVAGLINFMRNMGSSIGTSLVTTMIARRAQAHQVLLTAHTTLGDRNFTLAVKALSTRLSVSGLDASRAAAQAYGRVYGLLIRQATALAYIDTYWVLAIGAIVMFLLSFALRENEPGAGGEVAAG
jgi:MFS transporter, DHA2 family, multidrug resistance protein